MFFSLHLSRKSLKFLIATNCILFCVTFDQKFVCIDVSAGVVLQCLCKLVMKNFRQRTNAHWHSPPTNSTNKRCKYCLIDWLFFQLYTSEVMLFITFSENLLSLNPVNIIRSGKWLLLKALMSCLWSTPIHGVPLIFCTDIIPLIHLVLLSTGAIIYLSTRFLSLRGFIIDTGTLS